MVNGERFALQALVSTHTPRRYRRAAAAVRRWSPEAECGPAARDVSSSV